MVIEAEPNAPMIAENSEFGEKYGIHLSALQAGNMDILQQMLKHGGDPNRRFNLKRTKYGDVVWICFLAMCIE